MQKLIFLVALCAALVSCGGGDGSVSIARISGGPQDSCSIAAQRAAVGAWMQDQYYWYQDMRAPDPKAASMDAWFQSMLYKPLDRYSFTESTADFQQLFDEGTFTGYGYTLGVVGSATLRVRTVEPRGPAYAAGLRRGDTILSVDGFSPAEVIAGASGRVTTEGVPRTIEAVDVGGQHKTLTMVSANFPLTPVRDVTVLDATRNGQPIKVGYLDYTQFVAYTQEDLLDAIHGFAAQGATELVLDLRYNGGGDVYTSRYLASLIGGTKVAAQVFASLRFNDKNQANNQDIRFLFSPGGIPNLPRVFIIGTGSTASASELVINGLKPFMNVVLVGDTTYGKPYGFQPFENCGTTYNAVNFEVFNSAGVGGYSSGIAPTCPAADDLDYALGDPREGSLKTALGYIATGSCPQPAQSAALSRPAAVKPLMVDESPQPRMFQRDQR